MILLLAKLQKQKTEWQCGTLSGKSGKCFWNYNINKWVISRSKVHHVRDILFMSHTSVIFLRHVRVADMPWKADNCMRAGFSKCYKVFACTLSQCQYYVWQVIYTIIIITRQFLEQFWKTVKQSCDGLIILHQFFSQWEAKPESIALCTHDFSGTLGIKVPGNV